MQELKEDFDSLVGKRPLSDGMGRREFITTALGTGFAAAVLPVAAQNVIKTDTAGLTAGEVSITVKGQRVPVYRAQPEGRTNLPVVLVVSEIFGVHEHIADVARRFAKQGYLALAPDLFVRQGNPAAYGSIAEVQKEVISKVPDEQVMGDLDACVAWAGEHGGNTDKLGVTGFCWGGRLVGDKTALTPAHPVDLAASLKVPVSGLYGGKDTGIPLDTVEKMKAALAQGSSKSEFVVYPNSGHAFHADYRPSYVEADAKDGWKRCLAWFKSHGVA